MPFFPQQKKLFFLFFFFFSFLQIILSSRLVVKNISLKVVLFVVFIKKSIYTHYTTLLYYGRRVVRSRGRGRWPGRGRRRRFGGKQRRPVRHSFAGERGAASSSSSSSSSSFSNRVLCSSIVMFITQSLIVPCRHQIS